ncbi:hypothetical protein BC826DRAFT_491301 [Russula brevipes]|nr:hypothetical protein BC826DRAFT_491301 [Russula brevipes]
MRTMSAGPLHQHQWCPQTTRSLNTNPYSSTIFYDLCAEMARFAILRGWTYIVLWWYKVLPMASRRKMRRQKRAWKARHGQSIRQQPLPPSPPSNMWAMNRCTVLHRHIFSFPVLSLVSSQGITCRIYHDVSHREKHQVRGLLRRCAVEKGLRPKRAPFRSVGLWSGVTKGVRAGPSVRREGTLNPRIVCRWLLRNKVETRVLEPNMISLLRKVYMRIMPCILLHNSMMLPALTSQDIADNMR